MLIEKETCREAAPDSALWGWSWGRVRMEPRLKENGVTMMREGSMCSPGKWRRFAALHSDPNKHSYPKIYDVIKLPSCANFLWWFFRCQEKVDVMLIQGWNCMNSILEKDRCIRTYCMCKRVVLWNLDWTTRT